MQKFVATPHWYITLIADEMVAVFPDLSLLFANLLDGGEAYLCSSKEGEPPSFFKIDMEIVGGTGRFEGAGGQFTGTGDGYGKYFPNTPLSAETGEFKGWINIP